MENCKKVGRYFQEQLLSLKSKFECISDVRGKGLLIGLELSCDGAPFVKHSLEKGFLINCTQERVLRFAPPLIIEEKAVDALVACLEGAFEAICGQTKTDGDR